MTVPWLLLAASSEPSPVEIPDPVLVTPGTVGFLFTFFVAVAVVLLGISAIRRVRRVRARADVQDAYPLPIRPDARRQARESGSTGADTAAAEPTDATDTSAGDERSGGNAR